MHKINNTLTMKPNVLYTETLNLFRESEKVSQKKDSIWDVKKLSESLTKQCKIAGKKNEVIFIQLDYERVNVATIIITNYWRPAMG